MPQPRRPIVLIPARMASTRLPDKPLAEIAGEPMIVHVWRRAREADIGPVWVAAAEPAIVVAIERAGGKAVLTRADHPSGSDRIYEALTKIDPDAQFDAVVNVQGDLPTLDPRAIVASLGPLREAAVDIATLVAAIATAEERNASHVVKAVVALPDNAPPWTSIARALYFTRTAAPWGEGRLYHHIGLYAYRRAALERFVGLPQGILEKREKLEQLRALENGMRIDAALVDVVPLGVDTPADLEMARSRLKK